MEVDSDNRNPLVRVTGCTHVTQVEILKPCLEATAVVIPDLERYMNESEQSELEAEDQRYYLMGSSSGRREEAEDCWNIPEFWDSLDLLRWTVAVGFILYAYFLATYYKFCGGAEGKTCDEITGSFADCQRRTEGLTEENVPNCPNRLLVIVAGFLLIIIWILKVIDVLLTYLVTESKATEIRPILRIMNGLSSFLSLICFVLLVVFVCGVYRDAYHFCTGDVNDKQRDKWIWGDCFFRLRSGDSNCGKANWKIYKHQVLIVVAILVEIIDIGYLVAITLINVVIVTVLVLLFIVVRVHFILIGCLDLLLGRKGNKIGDEHEQSAPPPLKLHNTNYFHDNHDQREENDE